MNITKAALRALTDEFGDDLDKVKLNSLWNRHSKEKIFHFAHVRFHIFLNPSFFKNLTETINVDNNGAIWDDLDNMRSNAAPDVQSSRPKSPLVAAMSSVASTFSVGGLCKRPVNTADTAQMKRESGKRHPSTKKKRDSDENSPPSASDNKAIKSAEDDSDLIGMATDKPTSDMDGTPPSADVEDYFAYKGQGDEHEVEDDMLSSEGNDDSDPTPLAFDPNRFDLIEKMKGLKLKPLPSVDRMDLQFPEGHDVDNLRHARSIRGVLARGLKYHDPKPYIDEGFPPETAKKMAILQGHIDSIGDDHFSLACDETGNFLGPECKNCNVILTDVTLRKNSQNMHSYLKLHDKACRGTGCPTCGISSHDLYEEYKLSKYREYTKSLLRGEPLVEFDVFFEKALLQPPIGNLNFFLREHDVFAKHKSYRARGGATDCAKWHETAELFRNYVHHHKTDIIAEAKVTKYPGIEHLSKLKEFKKNHYDSNGDGSYGKRLIRYAGHRHAIVHAIHVYLMEDQTKGMAKLTKVLGFQKRG